MRIIIISGWSLPGGSTDHFIRLTNKLNANGYDCTFYGPHPWHLDKCKSGYIGEPPIPRNPITIGPTDILISHFIDVDLGGVKPKKHILSCHETNFFDLNTKDLNKYDIIHYVSKWQKEWHGVNHPHIIIPAMIDKIKWTDPKNNVAGVIGSIDEHKQTHKSIERALKDGYSLVKLFGLSNYPEYFNSAVKPFVDSNKACLMGFIGKEEAYNQISKVYSSSKRECLPLVQGECMYAGIPFEGLECNMRSRSDYEFDDEKILDKWKSILE